jgi:5-methylcytosine-specific restriction endonuclease McrA
MFNQKEYQRKWMALWRSTHRLEALAKARKHDKNRRRNKKRRDYMKKYLRKFYRKNRKEILAQQKQRYDSDPKLRCAVLRRTRKWVKENPLRARQLRRITTQRRIARLKGALGKPFTVDQWAQKVRRSHWRCTYCHRKLTRKTLEMDHRIPLARGGKHELKNLVPACRSCNARKGAKRSS